MRSIGGGRQHSFMEAWSSIHHLFTGETSELRRAHGFSILIPSWRSFQPSEFRDISCRVITAAGQSFLWRGFTFWHLSGVLEQIWQFQRGRTTFSSFWQFGLDSFIFSGVAIVPGSSCIVFIVLDHCSTHIYIISQNWFSPGGVLSRVIDQKYLCLHMHFSCCQEALFLSIFQH